MTVYHGSNHNIRTLRLRPDLTKDSSLRNEGVGIYFSLLESVARSYGEFCYTIEVDNRFVVDMRRFDMCQAYIRQLSNEVATKFGFSLDPYMDMNMLASYIQAGSISIAGIGKEVKNILDSVESFYRRHSQQSEAIFRWLDKWKGYPKVYLFTYEIAQCGVIKDTSPDVAQIVRKERVLHGS